MSANDAFLDRDRPHGEILLNFRGRHLDDLAPFAWGYREAGARLAATMAALPSHRDNDGYPILFLYRHALELYFKAILVKAYRLCDLVADNEADEDVTSVPPSDRGSMWKSHSLWKLYTDVETVLGLLEPHLPDGVAFLREWQRIVKRVSDLDDGSYSFRYPVTTKGAALHAPCTRINVLIFAEMLDELCHALDGACTQLHEGFQVTAEIKHAVQEFLTGRPAN